MREKDKYFFCALIAVSISSCRSVEKPTYVHNQPGKNSITATVSSNYRSYKLKKYQDFAIEEKFKNSVENSYAKTGDKYNANFTYSIKPQGAVYPFSDVDIVCLTDSKISLSKSREICEDFFSNLDSEYEKLKGELK